MKLSIITVNWNNRRGLEETMSSVRAQKRRGFEWIVVDGGSTDGSKELMEREEEAIRQSGIILKWVSERDKGIYNAMNKGIAMAEGEYCEFVNSGDCLMDEDVMARMTEAEEKMEGKKDNLIVWGNMVKKFPDGTLRRDRCVTGKPLTMFDFYHGTLNHSPAWIARKLFDTYGKYDENYKIVSDWKWYMKAIVFGKAEARYVDVDVTLFDMTGISETNVELTQKERAEVLKEMVPPTILWDYAHYNDWIDRMMRLKRHGWAYKSVWLLERVLFKWEKWKRKHLSGRIEDDGI